MSKLQLDFLKGGFRKSKNYKEYYDNTSKDLIEQKFKMDLDLFDYSFENKFSITKNCLFLSMYETPMKPVSTIQSVDDILFFVILFISDPIVMSSVVEVLTSPPVYM